MIESKEEKLKRLRVKAEAVLAQSRQDSTNVIPSEVKDLVHDLSVYQIELELQNEELRSAQQQMEKARDNYLRLYNQAPVGYLTLDKQGIILQSNQTFADMVGFDNTSLTGKPLVDFILKPDQPIFRGRYNAFFRNPQDKSIDLKFTRHNGDNFYGRVTGRIETNPVFWGQNQTPDPLLLVIVNDITQQKTSELALSQSEKKFRSFVELSEDAIALTDEYGLVTEWSRGAEKLFGIATKDAVGQTIWDIQYQFAQQSARAEEKYQQLKTMLQAHIANGVGPMFNRMAEVTVQRSDGTIRDIQTLAFPLQTEKGFVLGSISRDITERKENEKRIKLNEARLQSLFKISQYKAKNRQDLLDYTLAQALELTGSKIGYIYFYDEEKEQFILNNWSKDVMKECLVVEPQTIYELSKTGIWGEAIRQRKPIVVNDFESPDPLKKGYPEGHVKLYSFATIPVMTNDKIVAVLGVGNKDTPYDDADIRQMNLLMDAVWKIDERRQIEEALLESEAKFHRLFNNMAEGVSLNEMIYDKNGNPIDYRILEVNPAFERQIGLSMEKAAGVLVSELYKSKPPYLSEFDTVIKTGQPKHFETYDALLKKYLSISVFSPEQGRFATLIEDITQQKQLENSLFAYQKMASLGTLVAGIAHEINTPLQVITGTSESLLERARQKDQDIQRLERKLEIINRNSWKIAKIVQSLRTYAHGADQIQQFLPTDLNEIIRETVIFLEPQLFIGSNINIRYDLAKSLPEIYCDKNQINQLLLNLLQNSRDAIPGGGTIEIHTHLDEAKERVVLQIKDDGEGIPDEIQKKIFDPFFTTKPVGQGTGLGLSVVMGIMRSHGGEITFESQPGQDTQFYLYFPLKKPHQEQANEDTSNNLGRFDDSVSQIA